MGSGLSLTSTDSVIQMRLPWGIGGFLLTLACRKKRNRVCGVIVGMQCVEIQLSKDCGESFISAANLCSRYLPLLPILFPLFNQALDALLQFLWRRGRYWYWYWNCHVGSSFDILYCPCTIYLLAAQRQA
jgi:hypothetical protein